MLLEVLSNDWRNNEKLVWLESSSDGWGNNKRVLLFASQQNARTMMMVTCLDKMSDCNDYVCECTIKHVVGVMSKA